jgi:hypothetical protein
MVRINDGRNVFQNGIKYEISRISRVFAKRAFCYPGVKSVEYLMGADKG